MNLFVLRKTVDVLTRPLCLSLAKLPLHANHWTLIGTFTGIICGLAFLYEKWWIGLILLVTRGLVDHVDGFVARTQNQRSTFGAVMDDVSDRWVLGIMYAGGCISLSTDYPHMLIVLALGITGSLSNVIIKLSLYAESQQDVFRNKGKIGHPVDVVGVFGSAEFIIYFGVGVLFTAILNDPRPMLAGAWIVAIMSHVSLLQRVWFAWGRYRGIDPEAPILAADETGESTMIVG